MEVACGHGQPTFLNRLDSPKSSSLNYSLSVFIGGKFESRRYARIPNRCPTFPIENANTPPVETCLVYDIIPAEPHHKALVRASSVILRLACSAFPPVRAGFHDIHNAPAFTRFTKPIVQPVFIRKESQADEIPYYRADSDALENIYAAVACRAEDVRSSNGYLSVREFRRCSTL